MRRPGAAMFVTLLLLAASSALAAPALSGGETSGSVFREAETRPPASGAPSSGGAAELGSLRSASGTVIELERADEVVYLEKEQKVELTGNVRIKFEKNTIQADRIHLDLAAERIVAEGSLLWTGEDLNATGSRMTYDMKTREGQVDDVTLTVGPWICRGKKVVQPKENEVVVEPSLLTTCDAKRPHYSIRCKRVKVRLKKDITAIDVTLLAGSTPIFWLPALVTPIREFRLPFEAVVGRDGELGAYVRTSPAYQFTEQTPGQAHIDYFANKGWGYGLTQDYTGLDSPRPLRAHAYQINEREEPDPGIPRRRWELFGDGSIRLGEATQLSGRAAYVSDAHFRELYGNRRLALPTTAGTRQASALLSRQQRWGSVSVLTERVETQRLTSYTITDTGRYTVSSIHAPQVTVSARSVEVLPWLSARLSGEADRFYTWQNDWYVNKTGLTPGLEAYWRPRGLGTLMVTPRFTAALRDRGDRVMSIGDGSFREDINKGDLYKAENGVSYRPPIPDPFDLEFSHGVARRLNKIGYDPFGYHGLDSHEAGARLMARPGRAGYIGVSTGYDLRNKQDPSRRRWRPVTPSAGLVPWEWLALSADADYDLWYGRWRRASGDLRVGYEPDGPFVRLRPSFTNNRLGLPAATTTSQEYRIASYLYGPSFQGSDLYPNIFYVDGEVGAYILPGIRVGAFGQYDIEFHRLHHYTLTVARDLHCWELIGSFDRYADGGYRFNASMSLKAFPMDRIPLVSL